LVNFTNNKVIGAHVDPPKWTFFVGDYISAHAGCCHLKFLHMLQSPKLYFQSDLRHWAVEPSWALRHTTSWF